MFGLTSLCEILVNCYGTIALLLSWSYYEGLVIEFGAIFELYSAFCLYISNLICFSYLCKYYVSI